MRARLASALIGAGLVAVVPAGAEGLKQIGTIALPGNPLTDYGAVFIDQETGKGFLTNRDNKSVDIFDTRTDRFVARVEGFLGRRSSSAYSGPQGVVTVNGGTEAWASDGDSTIKVIDLKDNRIVATLSTGGKLRVGEFAYDAKNRIVIAANPNDEPPFVTLYSTGPDRKLLAKIDFPNAGDGIEREGWFAPTGMFYVPLPKLDRSETSGGLAEIDPRAGKVTALHRLENCLPHSLTALGDSLLYLGCDFPGGHLAVFDPKLAKVVAMVPELGGGGQNAANARVHQYYNAVNRHPGGPRLKITDTRSNTLLQVIPAAQGAHAVAVSLANNHVYLPIGNSDPCGGCIKVYAPE